MNDDQKTARRILFSGRVQGVGFRWSTRQLASDRPVTGYVRNLSDGRVELVVQGAESQIEGLLAALDRRFPGHVTDRQTEELTPDPALTGFEIRS